MTGAPRRAALVFVFVTVALDMLAIGVMIPVLPRLIVELSGGDTPRAAEIFGVFGTVWAVMQFLFQPVLGMLSDRFGRRPVILASNLGLAADYILMALAPTLLWLLIGRILSGVFAASISTAHAYIADTTEPDKRAGAYGVLGAAFGLGFVLGPALGGVLGSIDLRLPFYVAAGLSFANFLYGLFVLPESLPPERRTKRFEWRKTNPAAVLWFLRERKGLGALAIANFLQNLAHVVLPATFVLYAGHRYAWTELEVGLVLALVGICATIVQAGLVRPAVARFGERRAMIAGLAMGAAGFSIYGLAPTGMWFLIGVPVMAFWGLAGPSIMGLASRRVGGDEQGRLQGALGGLTGIAGILGPAIFTLAFARGIDGTFGFAFPGLAFLLAAAMLLAAALAGQSASSAGTR